ncbi:MAG: elongation factor G [Proteobacteria bacterium]|nr:elongation factor G [Cystobacterineae bacterium]MCL2258701.1 elongation factor G [Cystobacterineae bacterium]MCL2313753.1 elongation factor G [Pseudomonadota bacterium]
MAREYPIERYRNIGVMAHIDAGKTTTTERILYYTGAIHKMGDVDAGNTTTDFMEQERKRGITITSAAISAFWERKEKKYRINIIDTPGHVDFTIEVERCLRVLDGAVAVFDAVSGVEPQSETVWRQADKYHVPRICFINKMDRIGADFEASVHSIRERLGGNACPIQLPMGSEDKYTGAIDLLRMKALYFEENEETSNEKVLEIPEEYAQAALAARLKLLEQVAEVDDGLMLKFLEGDGSDISEEEICAALRKGCIELKLFPVLCGSSLKHRGVQPLIDAIVDYLPSPADIPPVKGKVPKTQAEVERETCDDAPFSALVFKIMSDSFGPLAFVRVYSGTLKAGSIAYNASKGKRERAGRLAQMRADKREELEMCLAGDICAIVGLKNVTTGDTLCVEGQPILLEKIDFPEPVIDLALEPKSQEDQEKLGVALQKLSLEDPSFRVRTDEETGQTIVAGMGELHLEIVVDRLLREYKVQANVGEPQVAYRETVTQPAEGEGKYIRQSGNKGLYGHVLLRIEPGATGEGLKFESRLEGEEIPLEFIPAIERGVVEATSSGVLAGYPLVDVRVALVGGSFDEKDSEEIAFKIAASMAFREACNKAMPVLLEPVMKCEVLTPEAFMGEVIGDLSARRGKILAMSPRHGVQAIDAIVPLAQLFGYTTDLRSKTQGRASFSMRFDHYAALPENVANTLIVRLRGY